MLPLLLIEFFFSLSLWPRVLFRFFSVFSRVIVGPPCTACARVSGAYPLRPTIVATFCQKRFVHPDVTYTS